MDFDASYFTLSEIIRVNKKNLEKKFLRINIENTEYVIFIDYVATTMMYIETCVKNSYIDENNPIEQEIIKYNQMFGKENIDFNNPYSYYRPYLSEIFMKYHFTISELSDRANDFLNLLIKKNEMIKLLSRRIEFKTLEDPISSFDRKFSEIIKEICIRNINADKKLQMRLEEIRNERIETERAIEQLRIKEQENEIKKEEFKKEIGSYKPKNSSDYNIRW